MNARPHEIPHAFSPAFLAWKAGRGKYIRTPFVELLNTALLDLAARKYTRLAVFAPPRHGKTRLLTEIFAAWFLGNYPTKSVVVASHSATLASKFGMNVRDLIDEFGRDLFGIQVRQDRRAADNWSLTDGGGMLSIGVGGSLVGFGADLFIFDDILADAAAALSETIRNNTVDWYESTAETRINAGGLQLFTMQRWHGDDPAARIVYANRANWHVINIPAIADHDPDNGETDPLNRDPGEALWPAKYPIEVLREMESRKPFWFAAQYQQRPAPRGGGMVKVAWVEDNVVFHAPDRADARVRFWDFASTEKGGDYSVGVLMSRVGHDFFVEDVMRGQWGSTQRDRLIRQTCEIDNLRYPNEVVTWGERQPSAAGKDHAIDFERKLLPYAAHTEPPRGNKIIRADPMASAFGRGEIHVRKGYAPGTEYEWFKAFRDEITTFPAAKHDDIVDACSGAFNKLALEIEPGGYAAMDEADYLQVAAAMDRSGYATMDESPTYALDNAMQGESY